MNRSNALRIGRSALAVAGAVTLIAVASPALAAQKATLGPYGYGSLKLGMSTAKAKATGRLIRKPAGDHAGCTGWDLKEKPYGEYQVGAIISKKYGLTMIVAHAGMKTPKGIGFGSTRAQLKAAYPDLRRGPGGFPTASVPGNKKAYYLFYVSRTDNRVAGMSLVLAKHDCRKY
ncbi:hypothetical protein [Nonomuraea gerenzanensis]|uniref:Secreted protein n=1 Tax=Nonomuraea gerenzanensis TaxID=93944 RepID=A0A1M4EN33_9ACTN|nr:hypothetical protein [Nonomuraea gerenzanensis]UBU11496.1 hypothetical protein LCN96_45465 [Nonomuraea gerenzanensis]SBO99983.1 hypothetical protein BN4615_P9499 [Nonomuraea gerenzanensis]